MSPSDRRATARITSHVLVGAAVAVTARQLFGRQAGPGIQLLVAGLGILAHERIDAPLADVVITLL